MKKYLEARVEDKIIKKKIKKNFIVMNGDTIFDINYLDFYTRFNKKFYAGIATTNKGSRFGKIKKSNINAGIYIFNRKIFKFLIKNLYL